MPADPSSASPSEREIEAVARERLRAPSATKEDLRSSLILVLDVLDRVRDARSDECRAGLAEEVAWAINNLRGIQGEINDLHRDGRLKMSDRSRLHDLIRCVVDGVQGRVGLKRALRGEVSTTAERAAFNRVRDARGDDEAARLRAEIERYKRLVARYRKPLVDGGANWQERAQTAHVRACDAEAELERLRGEDLADRRVPARSPQDEGHDKEKP